MFQQQEGEEQPPGMQGYAVTADAYPAYPYPQARDQYLANVPDEAMTQFFWWHRPRPVHRPVQNTNNFHGGNQNKFHGSFNGGGTFGK